MDEGWKKYLEGIQADAKETKIAVEAIRADLVNERLARAKADGEKRAIGWVLSAVGGAIGSVVVAIIGAIWKTN
jgi:hypothetical protein